MPRESEVGEVGSSRYRPPSIRIVGVASLQRSCAIDHFSDATEMIACVEQGRRSVDLALGIETFHEIVRVPLLNDGQPIPNELPGGGNLCGLLLNNPHA